MSNTRNMNQANNFWDLIASMQNNQGASPFAEGRGPAAEFNPFEGQEFWGPWAHRGRRHGPPHGPHGHHGPHGPGHHGRGGRRGPSPPPEHEGAAHPPPPHVDEPSSRSPSPHTPPETPAEPHHHPHPRHAGPPHHGPHHHEEHARRGRGGRGPRGGLHHNHPRGGPPAFPFDLNALAEAFAPAIFGGNAFGAEQSNTTNKEQPKSNDGSFTPSIDLFSTPITYILHTSLPGAKKSDLDITYNSTRNSITISGVITRPDVSETMMNCLIQDERREVGLFEREIKLEDNVKIDEEKIGAKLEDGVLRVTVPKVLEEEEGWESVRKVELE